MARFDPSRWLDGRIPDGGYAHGPTEEFARILGHFVASFAFLELSAMNLMAAAIGDVTGDIAQPIWAALKSNHARCKLVRRLLQEHQRAALVDGEADVLLGRFSGLIDRRNALVHGLWLTSTSAGTTFLIPRLRENGDHWAMQRAEEVDLVELQGNVDEVNDLIGELDTWHGRWAAQAAGRLPVGVEQAAPEEEEAEAHPS